MVGLLLTFFAVSFFDIFEIIKDKRKNEVIIYITFSIVYIFIVYILWRTNYTISFARIVLDYFRL